jgi:uncharacterized protein YjbI with pentapeptide repeats
MALGVEKLSARSRAFGAPSRNALTRLDWPLPGRTVKVMRTSSASRRRRALTTILAVSTSLTCLPVHAVRADTQQQSTVGVLWGNDRAFVTWKPWSQLPSGATGYRVEVVSTSATYACSVSLRPNPACVASVPIGDIGPWNLTLQVITGSGRQTLSSLTVTDRAAPGGTLDLSERDLRNRDLQGLDFTGVDLSRALLGGSNMNGSTLRQTTLDGTQLAGASISGVRGSELAGTPSSLPPGYRLVQGFLLGPGVNLSAADLSGFVLKGINLSGADLRGTRLVGSILTDANLSHADLRQADFSDATTTRTNLSGANFAGANMTARNFQEVKLGSGTITGPASESRWAPGSYKWVNGYLLGPGVVVEGADLVGANLRKMNLSGGVFTGTNFSSANLQLANLSNSVWDGANFTDALMKSANMNNASAVGATFARAGIRDADLRGLNAQNADFSSAVLDRSQIDGAGLDGVLSMTKGVNLVGTPAKLNAGYLISDGKLHSADGNLYPPRAPVGVAAIPTPEGYRVEWAAPLRDGGMRVTGYVVDYLSEECVRNELYYAGFGYEIGPVIPTSVLTACGGHRQPVDPYAQTILHAADFNVPVYAGLEAFMRCSGWHSLSWYI